eukprot:363681-Chlamydomonas_euryale.AAC.8
MCLHQIAGRTQRPLQGVPRKAGKPVGKLKGRPRGTCRALQKFISGHGRRPRPRPGSGPQSRPQSTADAQAPLGPMPVSWSRRLKQQLPGGCNPLPLVSS